jgi:hypothetical protein
MLGDAELPIVQEITTHEKRVLIEHKLPGFEGSVFQNMGRRPTGICLVGVATGDKAREPLTKLRQQFQDGQPLSFVADITNGVDLTQVRVADLHVEEVAGRPDRFVFRIFLEEYTEVQEPEPGLGLPLDQDLLDEAQGLMEEIVDGLDLGLGFATGLERFVPSLGNLLTRLQQFGQDVEQAKGG